ncbi:lysosome-associated membrane glycoprotein 1a [Brachyhypopomus gauderio]|uniref:lysosome-associated membrane glycoprotein 1a n=1 Tax=Brachyhypopomus gauderio TaxID=698409 RepID=UPI00404278F2
MTPKLLPAFSITCFAVLGWFAVARAVSFEVKGGNSTCIKAQLSANFSITYSVTNGTDSTTLPLPSTAVLGNGSTCGGVGVSPQMQVVFGDGHSLALVFSRNGLLYRVANLSLSFNLSDSVTFPLSSSKDVMTVVTNASGISAQLNTTYRCQSSTTVRLGDVNITLYDVQMEAYMSSDVFSSKESVCSADQPTTTTVAPTESPRTTISPSPTPPGIPAAGNYSVMGTNGTVCLLARLGLQLNLTYFSKSQNMTIQGTVNLDPNKTLASGSCESTAATLLLTEGLTNLSFTFTLNSTSNKYHLSAMNLSAAWPDFTVPIVSVGNSTLNYLQGTLGRSYRCTSEQVLFVTNDFSLNTFKVWVQPFGVKNDQFGSAEECTMDSESVLIPIIVGAALAGLVVIVLVAYLIGRKRSHAGYQTI